MKLALRYLRDRLPLVSYYAASAGLVLLMGTLSGLAGRDVGYTVLLLTFLLAVILLADGFFYIRRRRALLRLRDRLPAAVDALPAPHTAMEADYTELLRALCARSVAQRTAALSEAEEARDYYTLWVHQIKAPISAMRLVLQNAVQTPETLTLARELFRVEQYADLALRYVKLTDISSDLIIERCDLDAVVRQAVKKYAPVFIYGKLTVSIEPSLPAVVTDRRWLLFILEQLLFNALKYTHAGGVRFFMEEEALCIADTGVGIRPEDLPRIFEKGYTGCNGRLDARASGVGLYLVKRAADALGVAVRVESRLHGGTRVYLRFPPMRPVE